MSEPLRALIIEDSEEDCRLLLRELRRAGFDPIESSRAEDEPGFLAALNQRGSAVDRADGWQVILSDYNLPNFSVERALDVLRRQDMDIPMLVVSGSVGEAVAVATMKLGVQDYIFKTNLARLGAAIRRELEEARGRGQRRSIEREREQLLQSLRASEERYRLLFERNLAGVLRVNEEGKILDANPAAARILGCDSPGQLRGASADSFYPQPASRKAFLNRLLEQGQSSNSEQQLLSRDGRLITVLENATLLESGPEGLVLESTIIDITEYKQVAQQLQQSQRLETVGRLAGAVAHDFNNMLTVILGNCDLLFVRFRENSAAMRHVENIRDAGLRAASLTRQLLTFGRRQPMTLNRVDLGRLVRLSLQWMKRLVPDSVQLELALNPTGEIQADPAMLDQVLLNLIVNACDAMPMGGTLRLETETCEFKTAVPGTPTDLSAGTYARLQVSDTGQGMDAETQARIFEPYFTTKGPEKGTGLGLATVYGIVAEHHGQIRVQSQPGQGSHFAVLFPQASKTAPAHV